MRLEPGCIEVAVVRVDDPPRPAEQLAAMLSAEERARIARLHFDEDRRRAVVSRGVVRLALGALLGTAPHRLPIGTGPHGKPELASGPSFNVSGSGSVVVLAVAGAGRLGVDVEGPRPVADADALARRFFAPEEAGALRAVPAAERVDAFLRIWTRKEAFVKALGTGLATPLDAFSVSHEVGDGERLQGVRIAEERDVPWTVRGLDGLAGASAAVAWDRPLRKIRVRRWTADGTR